MITFAQLAGAPRLTYQKIVGTPLPSTLRRTAVRAMLEALGHVTESPDHHLHVARNGHSLVMRPLGTKKVESKTMVIALRRFLKRSESPLIPSNGREAHLLLVIGQHEIRLFRSDCQGGSITQLLPDDGIAAFTIAPPDKVTANVAARGPDYGGIFEPIATALPSAGNILIFGESSTSQPKMDRFIGWLKRRHPNLAERIVGSEVLDEDRLESGPLLAKAQEFYTHAYAHPQAIPRP